jgi:alpha-methylacyl-CoA racemase
VNLASPWMNPSWNRCANWRVEREANLLDGGARFYDTYACADGKSISVGAVEPQFYAQLLALTGADDPAFQAQWSQAKWPQRKAKFAALCAARTRDAWCELLEGRDACVAPVLDMAEAPLHSHNRARSAFIDIDGVTQPAPAPRFSRSEPTVSAAPAAPGQRSAAILADWGCSPASIEALTAQDLI